MLMLSEKGRVGACITSQSGENPGQDHHHVSKQPNVLNTVV